MKEHKVEGGDCWREILYDRKTLLDFEGHGVEGLYEVWISLNNPKQLNSYTTAALRELVVAFRRASGDPAAVSVVLTAVGDRAFCSGGNTKEYAECYAGRPEEYAGYMRLFNDLINAILMCDKPVINRVNGLRIGGGQEIGMACDFSIAADTARFGQAGPKHGSSPDGGATDFLHLFIGIGRAIESCTLCESISAHRAVSLGLVNKVVPVLKDRQGDFVLNPFVDLREFDEWGNPCYGALKTGAALEEALKRVAECNVDFSRLDREVQSLSFRLARKMPGCLMKTLESLRKKKLEHWQKNSETNRRWLALNMMTEGKAGFRAFNEGPKGQREVDFIALRKAIAEGRAWDDRLLEEILPR